MGETGEHTEAVSETCCGTSRAGHSRGLLVTWSGAPELGVESAASHFPLSLLVLHQGSNYYVRILSTIDRELLKPNASVALHKHSNALVDVLPPEADSSIMMLTSGEREPRAGEA